MLEYTFQPVYTSPRRFRHEVNGAIQHNLGHLQLAVCFCRLVPGYCCCAFLWYSCPCLGRELYLSLKRLAVKKLGESLPHQCIPLLSFTRMGNCAHKIAEFPKEAVQSNITRAQQIGQHIRQILDPAQCCFLVDVMYCLA